MFGLVDAYAQGVCPPKNGGLVSDPMPIKLLVQPTAGSPVSGTFVALVEGRYQFVLHGSGGLGQSSNGGPGSLAIRTVRLARGQSVPYSVAAISSVVAVDSTVTFSDRAMIAGAGGFDSGSGAAGGAASGGDVNVNGTNNGNQGASYGPFVGGVVGTNDVRPGQAPGGGGAAGSLYVLPGAGRLVVTYIGP